MSDNAIAIRPLNDSDSLDQLTELLHRSYKALADMGLRYYATHQSVEATGDRISNGTCFVAEKDGRIIGTVVYYDPSRSHGSPWLQRPEVAHVGQLAVEPALQRQGLATQLLKRVEETARQDGAAELALDTAEQARHLIEWYERRGYRFIEYADWEVTNYRSVIMSKTLDR